MQKEFPNRCHFNYRCQFSPMPLQFSLMHFNATIFFLACLLSLQWIRSRRVASRRVMYRSTVWHNNSSGRTSILFDVRTILLDATSLSLTDIYCSGGWDIDLLCLAPVVAYQSKIWQNNSPGYLFISRCQFHPFRCRFNSSGCHFDSPQFRNNSP